ncbi:hypothetical protein BT96DRAFT_985286 [Gymnopus androsaceus JB14]|uniref:RNI-like protein n=1 Tax=Gymnopus androsaceus JB14 TaxID=1447944 RepID=A0A6A4IEG8_9AGAR|nr:hypothetical protein BT96DRAFT_985286 [Gymnopus androsaceus JB14]
MPAFDCSKIPEWVNIWEAETLDIVVHDITFPDRTHLISRSSCTLTTLSLSGVIISDQNLIAALHLLPSIANLSTNDLLNPTGGSPLTSHFVSSMYGLSAAPLLPKLRSLSIKLLGTSFDDAAFIDISSR